MYYKLIYKYTVRWPTVRTTSSRGDTAVDPAVSRWYARDEKSTSSGPADE